MPVSVQFSGTVPAATLSELRPALEIIECEGRWDVVFSRGGDDTTWNMAISGPDSHRRVYPIRAASEGSPESLYLSALVRAEIQSFPSSPPLAFAFAVAELARQGIPYDDARASEGHIIVAGTRVANERLVDLYRREPLTRETVHAELLGTSELGG